SDRFLDPANALTILRSASVIGVVSIGMTFVIIGGGIDLSVGALVAISSVWATTLATQAMAQDTHWVIIVFTAVLVGAVGGLVNGVVIAYGKVAAFIATLAMLASARGQHPEHRDERRDLDQKSTRLNSSHMKNSYSVYCLKKKNNTIWS